LSRSQLPPAFDKYPDATGAEIVAQFEPDLAKDAKKRGGVSSTKE
jgi:hypothetical protein